MSNLPLPSFAAATAGTQYGGQAAAGPSNLFNPPQQQPAAPLNFYANPGSTVATASAAGLAAQYTPANMPIQRAKNAPKTFRGKPRAVEHFFAHLEQLFTQYHVVTQQDKCHYLKSYCSSKVQDFIISSQNYQNSDYTELKKEILKYYDADKSQNRYRPFDLSEFLRNSRHNSMNSLTQWRKFYLKYSTIAGQLQQKGIINDREYRTRIWLGFPKQLRVVLETLLRTQVPNHDLSIPYSIPQLSKAIETHFQRDKFTDMLFPSLGYDIGYDSDSEIASSGTDSDSDSDSESSDSEGGHRRRRKHRHSKKRKSKNSSKDKEKAPIVERERINRYNGTPAEIESMIHQLNTMSLQDPTYGQLYFKVMCLDATGLAAKCVYREPIRVTTNPQYTMNITEARPPPPPRAVNPYLRPPNSYPNNVPLGNPPQQRPMQRSENRCYGCYGTGHMLGECPGMKELINKNIIYQNPENRKYYMSNGQTIIRHQGESLYDAAIRNNSTRATNLITLTRTQQDEVSSADSDSESDNDDGPYWKYAFHAKKQL